MTENRWSQPSLDGFSWRTSSYSSNGRMECVEIGWRTSSYSSNGRAQCVEAGPLLDGSPQYAVRDSKHREHGALLFTQHEWAAFLESVKHAAA